jgi:O-antigen biosynthesis protein
MSRSLRENRLARLLKPVLLPRPIRDFRARLRRWRSKAPHTRLDTPPILLPLEGALPSSSFRVAVICHIFYPELAAEIEACLANIEVPFDLFVSTDSDAKREQIATRLAGAAATVEIRTVENRGRDIAPKYVTFRQVYREHDLVLFLHTKRSGHYDQGDVWRRSLMDSLAGSGETVRSILALFSRLPKLGVVFPEHHSSVRQWVEWGQNFPAARRLAKRMGIPLRRGAALEFPSGSMFWARTSALAPILDLDLDRDDFPPEGRQKDGTLAHALERLVLFACEAAGFCWAKVTTNLGDAAVGGDLDSIVGKAMCTAPLLRSHRTRG